jgi:hypothetical protein
MKESGGGDEYKYDIFDTFTCVNATMYPTQHKESKKWLLCLSSYFKGVANSHN